ncbi:hypothetical protein R6V09_46910 [Streptomyces sp. W16]|nr:hypothetical protein [Streptomyces sp. W16]MDV9177641.1 hypothetical protein [Streptomyces sp. W16]
MGGARQFSAKLPTQRKVIDTARQQLDVALKGTRSPSPPTDC